MADTGHLIWVMDAQPSSGGDTEYLFVLDPGMGLLDMDFHIISDAGWKQMQAPSPTATAKLIVPPSANIQDIERGVQTIRDRGKFRRVEISIRPL